MIQYMLKGDTKALVLSSLFYYLLEPFQNLCFLTFSQQIVNDSKMPTNKPHQNQITNNTIFKN